MKYVVCSVWTKNNVDKLRIESRMSVIEAESKEEAVGIYVFMHDKDDGYSMFHRPLVVSTEEPATNIEQIVG